jgi:3-oxoadipate CoA-transferase, beta subunit
LAVGAKEIRILVEHTTKSGTPRIRKKCGYPLTAAAVVRRIYTDLAVMDVTPEGLIVRELVEDLDFPSLEAKTEAALRPAPDLRPLRAPAV